MMNASSLSSGSHGLALPSAVPLGCEEKETEREGGIDFVAEISAELEKERTKNAELMERIAILEAQIRGREKASLPTLEQNVCYGATFRSSKKFKRQKIETKSGDVEDVKTDKETDQLVQIKHHIPCVAQGSDIQTDHIVNWMCMDEIQFLNFVKHKDGDSVVDCGDTDESDDDENYDEDDTDVDDKDGDEDNDSHVFNSSVEQLMSHGSFDEGKYLQCLERSTAIKQEISGDQNKGQLLPDPSSCQYIDIANTRGLKEGNWSEVRKHMRQKASVEIHSSSQAIEHKGSGSLFSHTKPLKVAFCPKEVRKIMESEELLLKNAQSHTIRKIIVFASLGIRQGCEDMYELDFNHFKILRKGKPYVSPKDPGEHVLYEYPGIRRKVFYRNKQNPVLCPVQILEEEKTMRPSDPSCPSCLFLCIKYGGRTRNHPQNEYVRQRMGRNKLKSFGPLMCQMALLVNIRSGSFFFKALGITLLFMAGFPDDMVQRETKYRNLDLLQKYYRRDGDTEGEELFLSYPTLYDTRAVPNSQQISWKESTTVPKSQGKKQTAPISKPPNLHKSTTLSSIYPTSIPPTKFTLMGHSSVHRKSISAFHPNNLANLPQISNASIDIPSPNIAQVGQSPPPYLMFPPSSINPFMPPLFWHNTNAYYSCPYLPSYGYHSIPHSMNYNPHHSQPYYSQSSVHPFMPEAVVSEKKDADSNDSDSGSSCSSSTEQKMS